MTRRALPAPILENPQVTLRGRVCRVWGGDNFEFGDYNQLHYIRVRGVVSPSPDEPGYDEARQATIELTRNRRVIIKVEERDMMMREIGFVFVPQVPGKPDNESWSDGPMEPNDLSYTDLGLQLIEQGWARYDGSEFEVAQNYQDAEAIARERKVGIWQKQD